MTYSQEPIPDPASTGAPDDAVAPGSFDASTTPDIPDDPNATFASSDQIHLPAAPTGPAYAIPAQPTPQGPGYAPASPGYQGMSGYPPYQGYPGSQYQAQPANPAYPPQGSAYAPYAGYQDNAAVAAPTTAPVETLYETSETLLPELRLGEDARDVMRYLTRDLLALVEDGWYNLAHALRVPTQTPLERPHDVYLQQPHMFVELLIDDLEHLLTDGIITGVQLAFIALDRRRTPGRGASGGKMFFHAIYRRVGYSEDEDDQGASRRSSLRRSSQRRSSAPTPISSVRRTRQISESAKMSLLMSQLRAEPDTVFWLMLEWSTDRMNAPATPYRRPAYHFNWAMDERSGALGRARYHDGAFHLTSVEVRSNVNTIAGQLP